MDPPTPSSPSTYCPCPVTWRLTPDAAPWAAAYAPPATASITELMGGVLSFDAQAASQSCTATTPTFDPSTFALTAAAGLAANMATNEANLLV